MNIRGIFYIFSTDYQYIGNNYIAFQKRERLLHTYFYLGFLKNFSLELKIQYILMSKVKSPVTIMRAFLLGWKYFRLTIVKWYFFKIRLQRQTGLSVRFQLQVRLGRFFLKYKIIKFGDVRCRMQGSNSIKLIWKDIRLKI